MKWLACEIKPPSGRWPSSQVEVRKYSRHRKRRRMPRSIRPKRTTATPVFETGACPAETLKERSFIGHGLGQRTRSQRRRSAPGLSWSPGREVRPRLLKVDPQDSTEFVRDSLLAYLEVEAWNEHLRRGRGEVRALVGDHPVATPVGRRMLQLEHDGVVGHARVDGGPAQRLDDPAGWAEVAQAERLAAEPSVVAAGPVGGLQLIADACRIALRA